MAKWIDKIFNASFITPYSRDILIPNLMVFGRLVQKKRFRNLQFDKSS